jgi:hypothetical protein
MYEGLAFILYPGLTLLDLVGPLQVLNKFITSAGVSAGIDMALYLVSKLTDESTARSVQLVLEYDSEPPFGRINWDNVDRNQLLPYFKSQIRTLMSDKPALLSRLSDL